MILAGASAQVDRACLSIAKLALVGMALTVLLQIWARYGFDYPFSWTEELARYLMIWAGLLGATCAFKRRLDPTVVQVNPEDRGLGHKVIFALTVLIFLLPILYYSFYGPNMNFERGFLWRSSNRLSQGMGINMALVGAIVPLSCTVILLHLAALLTKEKPAT
ncbi:TRAP transporter small permease subunit [Pseudophaeobacter sp.]|uniref:TRAP transporter small permease n=1 Tax=Pseudophaeobacter sp. TaxID=1971739 RepID=UPI003296F08C